MTTLQLPKMLQNLPLLKAVIASSFALPMAFFVAENALAGKDNFRVYNRSSHNIVSLYLYSSESDDWGPSIASLSSGDEIQIEFEDGSNDRCLYDIKADYDNGNSSEARQINVCNSDFHEFYD